MKPPVFWERENAPLARLLAPLGWLYAETTAWRLGHGHPWSAPVPVVCVGNLTAGGTGKTPIVRDLAARLLARGRHPAILSRGYGGSATAPAQVDPAIHRAANVGDEPLLLARDAPCWIDPDRARGARAAIAGGADIIVMDDGLQNPGLKQDLRLIVVDGSAGFGNRHAIPAGPLRENVDSGIGRAHGLIVVGDDRRGLESEFSGRLPVLHAHLESRAAEWLAGARVVAFAGIGRPEKFRATLMAAKADIAAFHAFPDHHPYREAELLQLLAEAERLGCAAVTTEKDWVRLDPAWRARVRTVPVAIAWREPRTVEALLDRIAGNG